MRVLMLLLTSALMGPLAHAGGPQDAEQGRVLEKPVLADTPEAFAQQSEWIDHELQPGGRYEFANPTERQKVRALLTQMAGLMQRAGSVAAMDPPAKIQLFNDQEEVNGILKHNDANRLICVNRKPLGSHIPQTECHTYKEIEATARNSRANLTKLCSGAGENDCSPAAHPGVMPHLPEH